MDKHTSSDNQTRADNQQGRLDPWYIVGFTDGEGCFSISIFKNSTTRLGYQVFPEYVLTQGAKSVSLLRDVQSYLAAATSTKIGARIIIEKIFTATAYDPLRTSRMS